MGDKLPTAHSPKPLSRLKTQFTDVRVEKPGKALRHSKGFSVCEKRSNSASFDDLQFAVRRFRADSLETESEIRKLSELYGSQCEETKPRHESAESLLKSLGFEHYLPLEDVSDAVNAVLLAVLTALSGSTAQCKDLAQQLEAVQQQMNSLYIENLELKGKLADADIQMHSMQDGAFLLEKKVKWWKDQCSQASVKDHKHEVAKEGGALRDELRKLRGDLERSAKHLDDLRTERKPNRVIKALEKLLQVQGEDEVLQAAAASLQLNPNTALLMNFVSDLTSKLLPPQSTYPLPSLLNLITIKVAELTDSASDLHSTLRSLRKYCGLGAESSLSEIV